MGEELTGKTIKLGRKKVGKKLQQQKEQNLCFSVAKLSMNMDCHRHKSLKLANNTVSGISRLGFFNTLRDPSPGFVGGSASGGGPRRYAGGGCLVPLVCFSMLVPAPAHQHVL